jgi:hypothetical protein
MQTIKTEISLIQTSIQFTEHSLRHHPSIIPFDKKTMKTSPVAPSQHSSIASANFRSIFLHSLVARSIFLFMCERQLIYRLIFNFVCFKLPCSTSPRLPSPLHADVIMSNGRKAKGNGKIIRSHARSECRLKQRDKQFPALEGKQF